MRSNTKLEEARQLLEAACFGGEAARALSGIRRPGTRSIHEMLRTIAERARLRGCGP